MRVIAGKYKGRVIELIEDKNLRPTRPMVREAVFSAISSGEYTGILEGSLVMDICSGSGSYAIEALSRGAAKAILVDNDRKHINLAKKNIEQFAEKDQATYICLDARHLPKAYEPVDIIFIDPPYQFKLAEPILKELIRQKWLHEKTIIIVELGFKEDIALPKQLTLALTKKYGISKILFLNVINGQL